MKEREARDAIKLVALLHGLTEERVYNDMQEFIGDTYQALQNGKNCALKEIWNNIPKKGDVPTPVEYIMYFSDFC